MYEFEYQMVKREVIQPNVCHRKTPDVGLLSIKFSFFNPIIKLKRYSSSQMNPLKLFHCKLFHPCKWVRQRKPDFANPLQTFSLCPSVHLRIALHATVC